MKTMSDMKMGWHFIPEDGKMASYNGSRRHKIEVGKTYRVKSPIVLCGHGLHASEHVLDALQFASSSRLTRVRLSGQIAVGTDKMCATKREVLAIADIAPVLHEFACRQAEQALALVGNPDPRSVAAIQTKRRWLRGEATDEELSAARDATWDAARAAASAAVWDATWDAARAAARVAARDAARVAARAAVWDAARAAVWDAVWDATWDAARAAARVAARDAASAAARDAARVAARDAAKLQLDQMVMEFMGLEESR